MRALLLTLVLAIASGCQQVASPPLELKPNYVDISPYAEEERAIVEVLNLYIEANAISDFSNLPVLQAEVERFKNINFQRMITDVKSLDFDNVPKPIGPNHKSVVVQYRAVLFNPIGSDGIQSDDKQLFMFQKEEGAWKFVSIADVWEGKHFIAEP